MTWQSRAACRGRPLERFFPQSGRPPRSDEDVLLGTARELCATCPVLAACGRDADELHDTGLRGGSLRIHPNSNLHRYTVRRLIPHAPVTDGVYRHDDDGKVLVEDHPAMTKRLPRRLTPAS